jgi:meromycolic acid enoyl-[acyl-carrier protein] reductase
MLDGKRILITGVLMKTSIAYATATRAQQLGAEVILTSFGRSRRITERCAKALPHPTEVLELDVRQPQDFENLTRALAERWGRVDAVLHAIAHAPAEAINGGLLTTESKTVAEVLDVSTVSLRTLAAAVAPLMPDEGGSVVSLSADASVAWPGYDWMGVAKAGLESVSRYLARHLGPSGVRVNVVAAGPLRTPAAAAFGRLDELNTRWAAHAPLGWDINDLGPVADATCFLFSDLSRGISGEILHVDGGAHAMGIL